MCADVCNAFLCALAGHGNDLWRYEDGQWTWMTGLSTHSGQAVFGTKGVSSTSGTPGATIAASGVRTAAGALALFGGYGRANTSSSGVFHVVWECVRALATGAG